MVAGIEPRARGRRRVPTSAREALLMIVAMRASCQAGSRGFGGKATVLTAARNNTSSTGDRVASRREREGLAASAESGLAESGLTVMNVEGKTSRHARNQR
jgi:hypothetical protein